MQTIVGMLVLDRVDLGAPIDTISPWFDMLIYTDEEMFRLLEEQRHRRFIKTHTPLDGLPRLPSVTYITMSRHPLDVALSYRDHDENLDSERLEALRPTASGPGESEESLFEDEPKERDAYLRWFIDNDLEPRAAVLMGWPITATRSRRTGMPGENETCICSTTPITEAFIYRRSAARTTSAIQAPTTYRSTADERGGRS
jgi:hypothetical protein